MQLRRLRRRMHGNSGHGYLPKIKSNSRNMCASNLTNAHRLIHTRSGQPALASYGKTRSLRDPASSALYSQLPMSPNGPKRRFAAPQRYVSNWGYSRPAWFILETTLLTCSVLTCPPDRTATGMVADDARHHALTSRFETSVLSHSASFDQRLRPETLRTAIATAFFCPTRMTSRLPRVTPV